FSSRRRHTRFSRDWSSDVCSSDLELVTRLWEREQTDGDLAAVIDALSDHAAGSFAAMLPFAAVVLDGPHARVAVRGEVTVQVTEIGRASCRERVEISVVGVAGKET